MFTSQTVRTSFLNRRWLYGHFLSSVACFLWWQPVAAQETFSRNDVADKRPSRHAFVNAHIYVDADTRLEHASLLVVEGRVAAVGTQVEIPPGTPTVDLKERLIYPSFIDPYVANFGLEEPKEDSPKGYFATPSGEQLEPTREGLYGANDAIKAEFNTKDHIKASPKTAEQLRKVGIGAVLSFRSDGIARGTGALVMLSSLPMQERVVVAQASAHYSFSRGTSKQDYPRSYIGVAALLRQMRYDAEWYASQTNDRQTNLSLAALHKTLKLPQIIEVPHVHFALLASKIGKETNTPYIIKGKGDGYQLATELARTEASYILPLDYPGAYEVEDPHKSMDISLRDMKHWELAPANAALLHKAGVRFAFTTEGLKDVKKFLPHLREAIANGLPKSAALRALTQTPAELLRADKQIGSLEVGRWANFFIASGDILEDKSAQIYEHWLQGLPYVFKDKDLPDYSGSYSLSLGEESYQLSISGDREKPKIEVNNSKDTITYNAKLHAENHRIVLYFYPKKEDKSAFRLSGWRSGNDLRGRGQNPAGDWINWVAKYQGTAKREEKKQKETKSSQRLAK